MATYKNFFETIEEALMRLRGSIVLYDGKPYHVWTITNHKPDGIFRIYMSGLQVAGSGWSPPPINSIPHGHVALGAEMDKYVDGDLKDRNRPVIRKNMDSPLFNKYRPFPLGMMNDGENAYYLERAPNRPKTEQGLIASQVRGSVIRLSPSKGGNVSVSTHTEAFEECVLGVYPSPNKCLEHLRSDNALNESVAFHRNFALVRGPINTMFLAYKTEIVGNLVQSDFSRLKLGNEFKHLKEAAQELNLFSTVS